MFRNIQERQIFENKFWNSHFFLEFSLLFGRPIFLSEEINKRFFFRMSCNYFEIVIYFEINPTHVSSEVLNSKFAFEITDIYEISVRVLSCDKICRVPSPNLQRGIAAWGQLTLTSERWFGMKMTQSQSKTAGNSSSLDRSSERGTIRLGV